MGSAASSLHDQGSGGALALAQPLPVEVLKRRASQRREMLAVQAASCSLSTLALLVYWYAGTVTIVIPSAYFLSGIALIGFFLVLSETNVNDRFDDHYLTLFQIGGHVALQLGFVLAAPEIGYAFLNVVFLIFGLARCG